VAIHEVNILFGASEGGCWELALGGDTERRDSV